MADLFSDHLSDLITYTEGLLDACKLPGIVISAGFEQFHFEDDISLPFRTNHQFRYWCPAEGPGHILIIEKGKLPRLMTFEPQDYWHSVEKLSQLTPAWTNNFIIQPYTEWHEAQAFLAQSCRGFALHGKVPNRTILPLLTPPTDLIHSLNWRRCFKSPYEIEQLKQATAHAAKGHIAAKHIFFEGGSEFAILQGYLSACGQLESNMPYHPIVAIDSHGCILHYQKRDKKPDGNSLLIDAGCFHSGYASDITRTYCRNQSCLFADLIRKLNELQLNLCQSLGPKVSPIEVNRQANLGIGSILLDHAIIKDISLEAALQQNIIQSFFPHGIGHFLGIQVHDVGGTMGNSQGDPAPEDQIYPNLRVRQTYEVGHVTTIEPGIYFIPQLLQGLLHSDLAKHINHELVEQLVPFGGIRIEDNLVITETGSHNLTREFIA